MRVRNALRSLAIKSLYESLDVKMICHVAQAIFESYDIYERTGCPYNIPLTAQQVAKQVIDDCIDADNFLDLIEYLIHLNNKGYMGKEYTIQYLPDMLKHIALEGFIYIKDLNRFIENTQQQATINWGRLHEGAIYPFTFLKIDIVKNSEHVRSNKKSVVEAAYKKIYSLISSAYLVRDGREWFWEGDGGLIAFYNGDIYNKIALTGIDIINKLQLFNIFENPLQGPVNIRIASHAGTFPFSSNTAVIKRNDAIREVSEIESRYTPINSLMMTVNVFSRLDKLIADCFAPTKAGSLKLYCYSPWTESQ